MNLVKPEEIDIGKRPGKVAMNPVDHPHGGGEEEHRGEETLFHLGGNLQKVKD